MKIILSAGHGQYDNKYSYSNTYEGTVMYNYSLQLKKELENYKNVQVILIRSKISDNPDYVNRGLLYKGDLYLALHSDYSSDSSARGCTVFDSHKAPYHSLAQDLGKAIATALNTSFRGVKYRTYEDRWSSAPASWEKDYFAEQRNNNSKTRFLIEHAFHSNKSDVEALTNSSKMLLCAKETARVIASYYKLQPANVIRKTTTLYKVQTGAFAEKANAEKLATKLKADGYDTYIIEQ